MAVTPSNASYADLLPAIGKMWETSAVKIRSIDKTCPPGTAAPVFTVEGRYTARGWTEWTQGFQHGSAVLQFDATGEEDFLELGRQRTLDVMAPHLTHIGVHDHGFNNVSTYGNLLRLMNEGRIAENAWERHFYELALGVSGAVQASRWSTTPETGGYIYSFNGPQSLFVDTIRSCRALAVSHALGHVLMGEQDERIDMLHRIVQHAASTAKYNVWYGDGRDAYDVRGRASHEALFNTNNGVFRAPSTQQGYSPFSTWTRGQAWAVAGYPELLEYFDALPDDQLGSAVDRGETTAMLRRTAEAVCDYYLEHTPPNGVPYWDAGAPGLSQIPDWREHDPDPENPYEPVDSSAAAIACQGLIRFGRWLDARGEDGKRYVQAGLTTLASLLEEPYLSMDDSHQGLLLHSVYHRPNDWDHIPAGKTTPFGESCMWGDYHLREAALLVQRLGEGKPAVRFFDAVKGLSS